MNETVLSRPWWQTLLLYVVLILAAIIVLYPIYSAINISLLSDSELASFPPKLLPTGLHIENFRRALEQAPLGRYLINSFVQSGLV